MVAGVGKVKAGMATTRGNRYTDLKERELIASKIFVAGLPGDTSKAIRSSNCDRIEFMVRVTADGSVTRVDMQVEVTEKENADEATAADWAPLQIEDIKSGTLTLIDHVAQKTISGPITIFVSVPARGLAMRLQVAAGVGSVTGSLYSVNVLCRA